MKLADAEAAFARGEYFEAQKIYKKIYNKLTKREDRPLRGEVAFKLGLCYDKLNMGARASAAFQNAIRYEYPDSTAFFLLGKSLQREGKYLPAITAYEDFMNYRPDYPLALEGIRGCKLALAAKDKPKTRYIVKNVKTFNSSRSDYAPMFFDKTGDVRRSEI